MNKTVFSKSKINGLKKFQQSTKLEWDSFVDDFPIFKPGQKITYSESLEGWKEIFTPATRILDFLNKENDPFKERILFEFREDYFIPFEVRLSTEDGVFKTQKLSFLDFLGLVAALYFRISNRLKSIEQQIGQEERKLEGVVRDKRACFRAIVRMLFKNLDDEHDTVNNFQDIARAGYLPLKQYHGHQIYRRIAFQVEGIAA